MDENYADLRTVRTLVMDIVTKREAAKPNPFDAPAHDVVAQDAEAARLQQLHLDELLNPELRYPHLAPFCHPTQGS
jgi:hypothetical protein